MQTRIYQSLASLVAVYQNCVSPSANDSQREWAAKHAAEIQRIAADYLPSGSGIDRGTIIDVDGQSPECLALYVEFHHMNEGGMYDGWTQHTIKVKPSLAFGFHLSISGPNRNGIKEYLHDVYSEALNAKCIESAKEN